MEAPSLEPRLLWRCRRGMQELDLLLGRFAREGYAHVSARQRRAFERLLELPDPLMAAYLLGQERSGDPELDEIIRIVGARG